MKIMVLNESHSDKPPDTAAQRGFQSLSVTDPPQERPFGGGSIHLK